MHICYTLYANNMILFISPDGPIVKPGRCPRYNPVHYQHDDTLNCEIEDDCPGTKKCCRVQSNKPKQCLRAFRRW